MKKILLILLGLWTATWSQAVLIPATRLTDWTSNVRVGVIGGIPNRTSPVINVSPPTSPADAGPAINAAINSAAAGSVVLISPGTYQLNTAINIGPNKDGITLRGAGTGSTIFNTSLSVPVYVGSSSDYGRGWPSPAQPVTGGLARDATTLTMADTSWCSVGQMVRIAFEDQLNNAAIQAGAVPVISTFGYTYLRSHLARVTAKTATSITFFPGLYHTPEAGLAARVTVTQVQTDNVGIEDLTINAPSVLYAIEFEQTYNCWIKNVNITFNGNYGIFLWDCLNTEIRHCQVKGPGGTGSNGAALLNNSSHAGLIEDNVFWNQFPEVEVNAASSGNVFAYNVFENDAKWGIGIHSNHNPHNMFNLYEGNVALNLVSDGYFGGESDITVLRNFLHGTNLAGTPPQSFTLSLKRFSRNFSLVGNVVGRVGLAEGGLFYGQPNIGNGSSVGTAQPTAGDFWADWKMTGTLTTRTGVGTGTITLSSPGQLADQVAVGAIWDVNLVWAGGRRIRNNATSLVGNVVTIVDGGAIGDPLPVVGTAFQVFTGTGGYQELDLDVNSQLSTAPGSTIDKGNYLYSVGGTPGSMSSLGGDTLPVSLFRASKPAFFGNLAWPAFDPATPNSATYTRIPAGYRFVNGVDPPSGGPDTTPPTILGNPTILGSGTQLTVGFSESVQFGAGGNGGWTATLNGVPVTVTYASGTGTSAITFNLGRVINAGETGVITYTQPGNGWQDTAAPPNPLAGVSTSITNNSTQGPSLTSATINAAGNQLSLVFSQTVQAGAGGNGGWVLNASPSAGLTFNTGVGSNTLIYDIGRIINSGETVTLNYTQPGNGIESVVGGTDVVSISNRPVTNNSTQSQATVATPVITLAAGPYFGTQSTTITDATAGAAIHYTTDGTTPTIASPTYSTPIIINSNMTIMAIATKSGLPNSAVATSAYEVVSWLITPAMVTKTFTIPALASSLPWTFTVTPAASPSNTVISLGPGPVATPADWSIAINFTSSGVIQARNGATFTATQVISYTTTPVVIRVDINWTAKTFSATANNITFATDYAFSTGQPAPVSLNNVGLFTGLANATISAMSFPTGPASARYIGLRGVPAAGGATP